MSIKILTDSCCDLPIAYLDRHSDTLSFVGMPITIGTYHFRDDLGKTNKSDRFYQEISKGLNASTAQITPNEFYELFKEAIATGDSIMYLGLSSGLSGTYNNALVAKQMIEDEGFTASIYVVDVMAASIGLGLIITQVIEAINEGRSADDIVSWLESQRFDFHHWFIVEDLHYLKRGGRVSPAIAAVGSALNVKPILTVNEQGKLIKHTNVRGRKKAIKYLSEKIKENKLKNRNIIIGHGQCYEDANSLKDKILEIDKDMNIMISDLSATITCHVGPNMLGVAFVAESRI